MQYSTEPFRTKNGLISTTLHLVRFSGTAALCPALKNEVF